MIIGADNKLYYSCGDLGNNQFNNRCTEIRSQKLPLQTDIDSHLYELYSGKILRLNFDGSIPVDNPYGMVCVDISIPLVIETRRGSYGEKILPVVLPFLY
jgi:hypothetical protein